VFQCSLAEIGTRMDPLDSHLAHGRSDPVTSHIKPVSPKLHRNPSAPVERPAGIDLVDPVFEKNLVV